MTHDIKSVTFSQVLDPLSSAGETSRVGLYFGQFMQLHKKQIYRFSISPIIIYRALSKITSHQNTCQFEGVSNQFLYGSLYQDEPILEAEKEINRILAIDPRNVSNARKVMQLPFISNRADLDQAFKKYARLLHPDKCALQNATRAFQIVEAR